MAEENRNHKVAYKRPALIKLQESATIGSGQGRDTAWFLRMPSGVLMGGLLRGSGLFLGV
jgi:hypothetical protein